MERESSSVALLLRFVDGFLQERSIRWMLALGVFILLGSSLLLVTIQWHDAAHVWKYLIFLAYTASLFGNGEWTYHRLGLRRTGTVLQALTVLLVPILFLALNWGPAAPGSASLGRLPGSELATWLLLGVLTVGLGGVAAWRVFNHFLRGQQSTFLVCYLLLAAAGAVLPWLALEWRPAAALILWAVFAAGTIKVNRHVFWLTEEHRKPRIFGFFPMALLGAQFLTLFLLFAASEVSFEGLGIGCVLVAIPVLGAGDAVARVFQQRTGDLVRPLPWSVLAPLAVGLTLCLAGVCLAATPLADSLDRGHALVVAAALAAGLMALIARRTGKSAFVWAMLAGVTIAYRFLPSFFIATVRALQHRGAELVHEERLPLAFYGLTCLPLLASLIGVAWCLRQRSPLFSRPMRQFSIALAWLLLALSLGHVKAICPVGLAMTPVFAVQVLLFRHRALAVAAVVAWLLAAYGLVDFLEGVMHLAVPASLRLASLTVATATLVVTGPWLDPWLARRAGTARSDSASPIGPVQVTSLVLTLALTGGWLVEAMRLPEATYWFAGLLALSLLRRPQELRIPARLVANWQALALAVSLFLPHDATAYPWCVADVRNALLPAAFVAVLSALAWQLAETRDHRERDLLVQSHTLCMRILAGVVILLSLTQLPSLTPIAALLAAGTFIGLAISEGTAACRDNSETRGWFAIAAGLSGAAYYAWFGLLPLGDAHSMFIVLGAAIALWTIREIATRVPTMAALAQPSGCTALVLPLGAVAIGVYRHFALDHPAWLGLNSLALFLAAGFYFWRGIEDRCKHWLVVAAVILNVAIALLCRELAWRDPQFFMIPIGITLLGLVQLFRDEIPEPYRDPLRYLGALVILVSPLFHIVHSWLHLATLMIASVGVVLLGIGVRVRALVYTGTAFLLADLAAMVVRGGSENNNVLWLVGLTLGTAVLALGAACERNREALLQRLRVVGEALKQWD
jgi:hypothetical protein